MATTPPPDYCAMLATAEKTYDDWLNGKGVIEFQDQNGERIKRSPANLDRLAKRIAELRKLCNPLAALRNRPRAIGFTF
jgi:hypothetical protein